MLLLWWLFLIFVDVVDIAVINNVVVGSVDAVVAVAAIDGDGSIAVVVVDVFIVVGSDIDVDV